MKIYVKPTIEVLELRANENMAATNYGNVDGAGVTPITKYTLGSGAIQTSI